MYKSSATFLRWDSKKVSQLKYIYSEKGIFKKGRRADDEERELERAVERVREAIDRIHAGEVMCVVAPTVRTELLRWSPGFCNHTPVDINSKPFTIAGLARLLPVR